MLFTYFSAEGHANKLVRPLCQNFGYRMLFGVKLQLIYIHFLEEKYMLFKKKDDSFFSCRIKVKMTFQSNVPFFII